MAGVARDRFEPRRRPRFDPLFFKRNAGLSFTARAGEKLVGTILGGQDGRRGFIHHLAVSPEWQRRGIGARLSDECLRAFRRIGIERCHIFVYADNEIAKRFWQQNGFFRRDDLVIFSKDLR